MKDKHELWVRSMVKSHRQVQCKRLKERMKPSNGDVCGATPPRHRTMDNLARKTTNRASPVHTQCLPSSTRGITSVSGQ